MTRGTQRKKQSAQDKQKSKQAFDGRPRSMVIRIGAQEVGSSVSQLVQDVRHVMEPDTAERRANKLKDYTTMCGPLGVSHLLLFSRAESGNTNLRLARTPRGPTLHFRVEKYSLCKDIMRAQRHPRAGTKDDFQVAPLLVMNNFMTSDADREKLGTKAPPKHLEKLVTDMFQGLFPPIQPHTTPLHTIKRVLLLNREPPSKQNGTCTISLRHYAITTKITGVPKAIRRLYAAEKLIGSKERKRKALPDLSRLNDVADFMLDPTGAGYISASETEVDTDAEVEVAAVVRQQVLSRRTKEKLKNGDANALANVRARSIGGPRVEKRAVKLVELGPRLKLRLTKVEEEICSGKIMWHEFVTKSHGEEREMEKLWRQRKKEKDERRRIQKENVERKRKEKADDGEASDEDRDKANDQDSMDEYDLDDDIWHDEDDVEDKDGQGMDMDD